MSTKRYCDVCQAEIVDRTDEFKLVLSATRHSVAIRVTPELWPNATTDICRNCLLGALCLAWGERTTGEATASKPAEPRDIVGSCVTIPSHVLPISKGIENCGQDRQYLVRSVYIQKWNGQHPPPKYHPFIVSADLTLQVLLP